MPARFLLGRINSPLRELVNNPLICGLEYNSPERCRIKFGMTLSGLFVFCGNKRAGAEVLSSGEEWNPTLKGRLLSAVRPFVSISGLARRSSNSSGEELTTPASPGITSIKNSQLKVTRNVMLSDRRESPWDETKHLALKFFTEHVLSETARFFAMLRMTSILHFTFYILNCLFRAGTDVLQKILRGKIFWLAPCPARTEKVKGIN